MDGFDGELAVRGDGTEQDVLSRRFAVKMRLSPATTAPARAPRRSVRLAVPAYSTYAMPDSIDNQASVCVALMKVRATSLRPYVL